jgi:hypothetical protein
MDSNSLSSPTDATMSLVTDGKRRRMTKGKAFGSPIQKLVKCVGGCLKETSAAIPSSTKRKTQQGQTLAGQWLVLDNKDVVIPAEAMWSTEYGTKCAWGTSIMSQPGGNDQQKTGHLTPMEIAVKRATWKSLINNLYLDGATHDLKGEDEAYKFASWNALGGLLVFTRFFQSRDKIFHPGPLFRGHRAPLNRDGWSSSHPHVGRSLG